MTIQIKEVNCSTGEEIIRDMTAEELANVNARKEKAITEQVEAEVKAQARQAILDRLGLTEEEARLLVG